MTSQAMASPEVTSERMTSQAMASQDVASESMTSQVANPPPPIFTIYPLPTYDDAVKSSGSPPSYEQAMSSPVVETTSHPPPDYTNLSLPPSGRTPQPTSSRVSRIRKRCTRGRIIGVCLFVMAIIIIRAIIR